MRNSQFVIALSIFCILSVPPAFAEENVKEIASEIRACLRTSDLSCLKRFIPERMYFPEQTDYGCKTSDTNRKWYISPDEFATCAQESRQRINCGDNNYSLAEVLRACFVDKKAEYIPGMLLFKSDKGLSCHVLRVDGRIRLSGARCAC